MKLVSDRGSEAGENPLKISFEFFPPKTEVMDVKLWTAVKRLAPLAPEFVSVTYGAGGSTRSRTHATIGRILSETDLTPASHLTCVDATQAELDEIASDYWDMGVRHIVALRGDPQDGIGTAYRPSAGGYAYADDLVAGLKRQAPFEVSVSAYPERHPESGSWDTEIDVLKRKVDAGADRAITQFFFDNDLFEAYLERVRAAGITIPIVPGILPIHNFSQVESFAGRCGASVPGWLRHRFAGLDDDPVTRQMVAATVAAEQVFDLTDRGIDQFHFYTMNRAELVFAICHMLGRRPNLQGRAAA